MKLKIGEKEFRIKFGYKPTLKSRIISRVVKMSNVTDENGGANMEKVEDLLMFLPEFLLVGLQVYHEEYRYDYDTEEGKAEQLDKAFSLVESYLEGEDADIMGFFNQLQEAMMEDSFLAGLFRTEKKKAEQEKSMLANKSISEEKTA
ncbi:MAG: hypothetical protein HFI93_05740 [Lachnospiraceae bacterium]|nr:hypothetical protein [Lachnospiraceae bacterium]